MVLEDVVALMPQNSSSLTGLSHQEISEFLELGLITVFQVINEILLETTFECEIAESPNQVFISTALGIVVLELLVKNVLQDISVDILEIGGQAGQVGQFSLFLHLLEKLLLQNLTGDLGQFKKEVVSWLIFIVQEQLAGEQQFLHLRVSIELNQLGNQVL